MYVEMYHQMILSTVQYVVFSSVAWTFGTGAMRQLRHPPRQRGWLFPSLLVRARVRHVAPPAGAVRRRPRGISSLHDRHDGDRDDDEDDDERERRSRLWPHISLDSTKRGGKVKVGCTATSVLGTIYIYIYI